MKTQAFIPVFKVRIKKLRKSITEELEKTKSERRKEALKSWTTYMMHFVQYNCSKFFSNFGNVTV